MADFVAVLKKTIDAQADQSPELRQRVYAKARATIEQKLVTANAAPAVAVRQRKILEEAIAEVEAFYAPPPAADLQADPLEGFLLDADETPRHEHAYDNDFSAGHQHESHVEDQWDNRADDRPHYSQPADNEWMGNAQEAGTQSRRREYADIDVSRKKKSYKGLIFGLIGVLALGGVGYVGWTNKDKIQELASSLGRKNTAPEGGEGTASAPSSNQPSAQTPTTAPTAPAQQPEQAGEQKLTQRLMPDGSEVDSGSSNSAPTIGEGTSTAAATPNNATPPAAGQQQPVAAGQQALLYEERGGTETGSVEKGSVVWSVISESPEAGQPAQPAVRGQVTMPDSKLELKMTIRKNTDQSIPASHLIEMVFSVPDNFSGGVVDNVQRITFKDTEQAAGNPLVAVPSKIADNFFIVWLNDAKTAQDTNLSLMRRLQWIDIPITYRNGRRALISLEKGPTGAQAFKEVLGAG